MRLFRPALQLTLALCALPALVLAKPDAAEAAARAAAPALPLRPIAQYSPAFAEADKIVGGQLADANDSKWVVALVTNSRVSQSSSRCRSDVVQIRIVCAVVCMGHRACVQPTTGTDRYPSAHSRQPTHTKPPPHPIQTTGPPLPVLRRHADRPAVRRHGRALRGGRIHHAGRRRALPAVSPMPHAIPLHRVAHYL